MKLGFTFYPQDWWSSDSFFELNPTERYIYLECLFLMYHNEGYMKSDKTYFENRMRIKISEEVWAKITSKFIKDGERFTCFAVNKRLKKAEISRENGVLGGRPKTQKTQLENLGVKPKEKEKVKEKVESKSETESETDFIKILGEKSDLYVTIQPKELHSIKYRIYGEDGLNEIYHINMSHIPRREFTRKFLIDRNGKSYNSFQHLFNDFNSFIEKTYKR